MNKRIKKKKRDQILDLNIMIGDTEYDIEQRYKELNCSLYDDNGILKADTKLRSLTRRLEKLHYKRVSLMYKRVYKKYIQASRLSDEIINMIKSSYNYNISRYDQIFYITEYNGKDMIFVVCDGCNNKGLFIDDKNITLGECPSSTSFPMCLAPAILIFLLRKVEERRKIEI